MQRRFILAMLATAVASSVTFLWLIIELIHTNEGIQGIASLAINSLAPPPGATATATSQPPSGNDGVLNPTIIAALIGLGGIIVGAVIAGGFSLYQARRTAHFQE